MVGGGTVAVGDAITAALGNNKMLLIDTGANINAATTYPGQVAYCTSSGSGFTADTMYIRNAANNAWNVIIVPSWVGESAEQSSTPITDNEQLATIQGGKFYVFFTIPATYKYVFITALECKNGLTVSGNVQMGVETVDANPPVDKSSRLHAFTPPTAQAGANLTQKITVAHSIPIKGGKIVGAWLAIDNATGALRFVETAAVNSEKATGFTFGSPNDVDNNAWVSQTHSPYIKIYYVGYN